MTVLLVSVVGLVGFAMAVTVLSTVAAARPDRAAAMVVVTVAGAAVAVVGFVLLVLGIVGMEEGLEARAVLRGGPSPVHPVRAAVGLGVASVLLGAAAWLVRTGDWSRADT